MGWLGAEPNGTQVSSTVTVGWRDREGQTGAWRSVRRQQEDWSKQETSVTRAAEGVVIGRKGQCQDVEMAGLVTHVGEGRTL